MGRAAKYRTLAIVCLLLGIAVTSPVRADDQPRADDPTAPIVAPPAPPPPGVNQTLPHLDGPDGVNDGAPVGQAAPPTSAGRTEILGSALRAGLEVFAQYGGRAAEGTPGAGRTWTHDFDVARIHGAIEGRWKKARGRILLETVRLAEDLQTRPAGDGLVLHAREAWGSYAFVPRLEVSAGIVPTITIPELDGTWMMRIVAPASVAPMNLLASADVGARARLDLPRGYGWVATAAYGGTGYDDRMVNRGKSVENGFELHPLAGWRSLRPLALFGSLYLATNTEKTSRAARATLGPVWQGSRIRLGAVTTWAEGVGAKHDQEAIVTSIFARVEPVPRILLGARVDHAIRDLDAAQTNAVTTLWGAVGYRLALPVETYLAVTRAAATTQAEREAPGSDFVEIRVLGRVVF